MSTNPVKSLRATATEIASFGREVARYLSDIVEQELPPDYQVLQVLSERIWQCNQETNLWFAADLVNKNTGECFDGSSRFWQCGSRLCPYCSARNARRNRARIRAAVEDQRLLVGENFHFITLTIPTIRGLSLLRTRELFNASWQLFRKRKYFLKTFVGGAKAEEFTVTARGFNYHFHLLTRSKYIAFDKLRAEWTDCVQAVFENYGEPLTVRTADQLLMVNVQRVTELAEATQEICKYLTKSNSWYKLKPSDLLEIARIKRFPRTFELFGSFKSYLSSVEAEDLEESPRDMIKEPILDTRGVSDGESSDHNWRHLVSRHGAAHYLEKLREEIRENYFFRVEQLRRNQPQARFFRLRRSKLVSRWVRFWIEREAEIIC